MAGSWAEALKNVAHYHDWSKTKVEKVSWANIKYLNVKERTMSKRKNKSRFTKTDVNTICQMQRKIDAYEAYIMALAGGSRPEIDLKQFVICVSGTDMDDWVSMAWDNIRKMKDEIEQLRAKDEMNKITKKESV